MDTNFNSSSLGLVLLPYLDIIYVYLFRIMKRKGKISRKTKETSISVDLNIDGKGKYKIDTGIGFLNHMLEQLSKHSSIDMNIKAKGDTHIDLHHTTEDTGIAIGEALKRLQKNSLELKDMRMQ